MSGGDEGAAAGGEFGRAYPWGRPQVRRARRQHGEGDAGAVPHDGEECGHERPEGAQRGMEQVVHDAGEEAVVQEARGDCDGLGAVLASLVRLRTDGTNCAVVSGTTEDLPGATGGHWAQRSTPMQALLEELMRLEVELAWLAADIDAEIVRLTPADPLLNLRRPRRRRYALAARRPTRRVPSGRHPVG